MQSPQRKTYIERNFLKEIVILSDLKMIKQFKTQLGVWRKVNDKPIPYFKYDYLMDRFLKTFSCFLIEEESTNHYLNLEMDELVLYKIDKDFYFILQLMKHWANGIIYKNLREIILSYELLIPKTCIKEKKYKKLYEIVEEITDELAEEIVDEDNNFQKITYNQFQKMCFEGISEENIKNYKKEIEEIRKSYDHRFPDTYFCS